MKILSILTNRLCLEKYGKIGLSLINQNVQVSTFSVFRTLSYPSMTLKKERGNSFIINGSTT